MVSSRRFGFTLALALFLGWVFTGALRATGEANPETPAPKLPIKVDLKGGGDVPDADASFSLIKIRTIHGNHEYFVSRIKSLAVEKLDDGKFRASLEMTDHSHTSGELLTTEFPILVKGSARVLKPDEFEKFTFLHPKVGGLLAILLGLLTLTLMEIVLGIDNVIFLAIVAGKLPVEQQKKARRIGLAAALGTRLMLLATLWLLLGLTKPVFTLPALGFLEDPEARAVSWRDIILLVGGMFLIGKSTYEMREKVEHASKVAEGKPKKPAKFATVIAQIAVIDIIFSLDSVITAAGMVEEIWVMVTAMLIAVAVMVAFAESISRFVDQHPTIKVLALSFLILIGALLVAEGLGQHIDKGYIYFAMAFSVGVELINMKLRGKPAIPAASNPAPVA